MSRSRTPQIALLFTGFLVAGLLATLSAKPWLSIPGTLIAVLSAAVLVILGTTLLLRWFLWKVGRRLAFSYFLIGIVPIPLVFLLLLGVAYLLSGFFLGHQVRDALADYHRELQGEAEELLGRFEATPGGRSPVYEAEPPLAAALYRGGRKIAGAETAPAEWPTWLEDRPPLEHLVQVTPDGDLTLAALAASGEPDTPRRGVLVFHQGSLDAQLREATGFWVETYYPGEPGEGEETDDNRVQLSLGDRQIPLRSLGGRRQPDEARAFFALDAGYGTGGGIMNRPSLYWGELPGSLRRLADGELVSEETVFGINATPRSVQERLFSGNQEVDSAAGVLLIVVAGLLADVYLVALLMAVFLIFGLSRAVNRLSSATEAVQAGDFSTRIPVSRKDQVGELQRNFNRMAENLETLVASATQKELLEQELAIARDLQESLLPRDLDVGPEVDVATLFLPSAAIGGDYYDVLRLSPDRLLVVVADVSGHGLPTGLRMAMLKAALTVLVDRLDDPEELLLRLDGLIRADGDRRFFVTATLALLDLTAGVLTLHNAGHPPTYLVRGGQVEEIVLPAPPLGTLQPNFGRARRDLEPGDVLVWMSDGMVEATDADDEPFGYGGVRRVLSTPMASAKAVREALLRAVAEHAGEQAAGDDRTLVVLRYLGQDGQIG